MNLLKKKGNWGLQGLLRHGRRGSAQQTGASERAMHEARRSMLRKLSLYFAKAHGDN